MFKVLNQWILDYIAKKSGEQIIDAVALSAGGGGIDFRLAKTGLVQGVSFRWHQIDSLVAVREAGYVGDTIVILLTHDNGRVLLNENITGFAEFIAGCEGKLNGVKSSAQWQVELLAKELGVVVVIYERTAKLSLS